MQHDDKDRCEVLCCDLFCAGRKMPHFASEAHKQHDAVECDYQPTWFSVVTAGCMPLSSAFSVTFWFPFLTASPPRVCSLPLQAPAAPGEPVYARQYGAAVLSGSAAAAAPANHANAGAISHAGTAASSAPPMTTAAMAGSMGPPLPRPRAQAVNSAPSVANGGAAITPAGPAAAAASPLHRSQ